MAAEEETAAIVNAGRSFLRYVAPGMTAAIELLGLALLSRNLTPENAWKALSEVSAGSVLALALASGVVGHFLGVIHHCIYSLSPFGVYGIDHLKFVETWFPKDLEAYNWWKRRGAWQIVTVKWHEKMASCAIIKTANPRVSGLTDLMHGAGAALIGFLFAAGVWFYLFRDSLTGGVAVVIALLLILHIANYWSTLNNCRMIVERILGDVMRMENLSVQRTAAASAPASSHG